MKENKAPDKLYIDSREHWRKSWTAFTTKAKGDDIEYTRTDAFVEEAETYLKERFAKDVSVLAGGAVHINFETAINNFINYMKGE